MTPTYSRLRISHFCERFAHTSSIGKETKRPDAQGSPPTSGFFNSDNFA